MLNGSQKINLLMLKLRKKWLIVSEVSNQKVVSIRNTSVYGTQIVWDRTSKKFHNKLMLLFLTLHTNHWSHLQVQNRFIDFTFMSRKIVGAFLNLSISENVEKYNLNLI